MNRIRVMIVDDHPMIRRGLRNLLCAVPDLALVGDFDGGLAALENAPVLLPDVVLIDMRLPGMDGIALAQRLAETVPSAKVIHLTAYEDEEYLQSSFRVGAYAYLLKSASDVTVVDTIRRVHAGERLLSPYLMNRVLRQFGDLAQSQVRHESGLDDHDLQILQRIAAGATNEEIAQAMHRTERTINRRVDEIREKLGTRNRTQAVAEAIKRGLI